MLRFQTSILDLMLDDSGVLHCTPLDTPITYENMVETISILKSKIGPHNSVCLLIDATYSRPMDKKTSEYAAGEFVGPGRAVAIYSKSTFGALTANVFFHFYPQKFPIRYFTDKNKALEWLRGFIVTG